MTAHTLVLYSAQETPEDARVDRVLLSLVPPGARVGFIPSSGDPDRSWFRAKHAYYARLGLTLDPYTRIDRALDRTAWRALLSCDAIHFSGGNTYYFVAWLRRHGLQDDLRAWVANGGVYVGVSAGAILSTPHIGTTHLGAYADNLVNDDPTGLHLVNFAFQPHFDDSPGLLHELSRFATQHAMPVYACPDGSGVIVQHEQVTCVGEVIRLDP